jgi:hypothetical protein
MSSKGKTRTGKQEVQIAQRHLQAMELRIAGYGYVEIANKLGYLNPGSAYKAVQSAIKAHAAPVANEIRELEAARLDRMTKALWPFVEGCEAIEADPERGIVAQAAIPPDLEMLDRVLKIMQRRARMLGLDEPTKKDVVSGGQPVGYRFIRPVPPGQLPLPETAEANGHANGDVWDGERNG